MTKNELIQFLKDNLRISMEDDGRFLEVKILLGDEVINSETVDIYR